MRRVAMVMGRVADGGGNLALLLLRENSNVETEEDSANWKSEVLAEERAAVEAVKSGGDKCPALSLRTGLGENASRFLEALLSESRGCTALPRLARLHCRDRPMLPKLARLLCPGDRPMLARLAWLLCPGDRPMPLTLTDCSALPGLVEPLGSAESLRSAGAGGLESFCEVPRISFCDAPGISCVLGQLSRRLAGLHHALRPSCDGGSALRLGEPLLVLPGDLAASGEEWRSSGEPVLEEQVRAPSAGVAARGRSGTSISGIPGSGLISQCSPSSHAPPRGGEQLPGPRLLSSSKEGPTPRRACARAASPRKELLVESQPGASGRALVEREPGSPARAASGVQRWGENSPGARLQLRPESGDAPKMQNACESTREPPPSSERCRGLRSLCKWKPPCFAIHRGTVPTSARGQGASGVEHHSGRTSQGRRSGLGR